MWRAVPGDEYGDQRTGGGAVGTVRSAADIWDIGGVQRVLHDGGGGVEFEIG